MRIFAVDPTHFAASQLRFLHLLRRYWWLLLLLNLALLLHTMRNAPVLPLLVATSLLIGAGSYFLLLRFDLTLNRPSVAFGLLIFMAMWPVKHLSGAVLLGWEMQLLLTLRYLAGIFIAWSVAVPLTRHSINRLISQKTAYLQQGEPDTPEYQPLRPTLDFARLRRHRDRLE
ncbi:MAG: hypothetical protein U1F55_01640 [Chitinivorax sp.]